MKMRFKIFILAVAGLMVMACEKDQPIKFETSLSDIEIGACGGVEKVKVMSDGAWVASMESDKPWVTISPANGRGTVTCDFIIDSALTVEPRRGVVTIRNVETNETQRVTIEQKGFDYIFEILDNKSVELARYAEYGKRYFDVEVRSNFDFNVAISDESKKWLSVDSYNFDIDPDIKRPRTTKLRFNWKVNNSEFVRRSDVSFNPKASITVAESDVLRVEQEAAEKIIPDTPAGDSLALLNINMALQCWTPIDTSQPMNMWNDIVLWDSRMEGCTPEKVGRVKYAKFFFFDTQEGIPYEVKYLTAAEELYFFSNVNEMLKSIDIGDHIGELGGEDGGNLKRLTVGAYGLTKLPASFAKLKNLEYLDLGSNNFAEVPDVLTPENFPKLHALVLNDNKRRSAFDMNNSVYKNQLDELGGFAKESEFPKRLLLWEKLDTLVLSVNFLQGKLPDFENESVPRYTEEEVIASDTLPSILVGTPKILPYTKAFRINHNRLIGEMPFWLKYHPSLDWWVPYSLVFPQEGRDIEGRKAGFDNVPENLNYYYEAYTKKEYQDTTEQAPVE